MHDGTRSEGRDGTRSAANLQHPALHQNQRVTPSIGIEGKRPARIQHLFTESCPIETEQQAFLHA
ncbi:MAG TPA: hypothetical protein VN108_08935, partial [Marmoricola sp.]|nr:hypothetical protein [Marmoricola sp.]